MRTREGMKVAKARGRLRGKQPKLTPKQEGHPVALHKAGAHTNAELAELFSTGRSTVNRALDRSSGPHYLLTRIGPGDSTVTSIPSSLRSSPR